MQGMLLGICVVFLLALAAVTESHRRAGRPVSAHYIWSVVAMHLVFTLSFIATAHDHHQK